MTRYIRLQIATVILVVLSLACIAGMLATGALR